MKIEVSSADYSIIDSGSVLTFDNRSDLSFDIRTSDDFSFTLVLSFESDNSGKRELSANTNGNTITLTCKNFNNSLGTGTTSPIKLGVFQGKEMYIHFWVYSLGDNSNRKVSYTFYVKR